MTAPDVHGSDSTGGTTRRNLLTAFSKGAVSAVATPLTPCWAKPLAGLHIRYDDQPAILLRSKEGRSLSRDRYESAEIAFMGIEAGYFSHLRYLRETLHQAGSVAKLALCAYLLDVGFSDAWNAAHIRQDIDKSLAYANATGFGHDCPDMGRLAIILSPFWKWGYPRLHGDPPMDDGGFTSADVRHLVRALLDRVHDLTGHPRPKGCRRDPREARA